jgi:uncharacterized protein
MQTNTLTPSQSRFHLAFHVTDLDVARDFYSRTLGCAEGRSTDTWVDFDFFGHQISLHLGTPFLSKPTGRVGDVMVPMPHFGVVLPMHDWQILAKRLESATVDFVIRPGIRFPGEAGEQGTMFFNDPFGNPIEIKGFVEFEKLFAR